MLQICSFFWKSEPQYAYKRYAYKKKNMYWTFFTFSLEIHQRFEIQHQHGVIQKAAV